MTEPISLARARAEREQNSKLWTPLDCLKALITDIEAGIINPAAVYVTMVISEDAKTKLSYACAGLSRLEAVGLLAQQLHETMSN